MALPDLIATLREVESLKHNDDYNLRIAAAIANHALFKATDIPKYRESLREAIRRIREVTKLFMSMDPGLNRIHHDLGAWYQALRPGPRAMDDNPMRENPLDNPIHLPDGDTVPGAVIYQYAVAHNYSREFAEEMEAALVSQNFHAKSPEEIYLYLVHVAASVRMNGTVLHGPKPLVDQVTKILRQYEIMYDRYTTTHGQVIWVPLQERDQAVALLRQKGFTR